MDFRERFRVEPGKKIKLSDRDSGETPQFKDKAEATRALIQRKRKLEALQDLLYADHRFALLIVLQGMDAAGKDGTIKHVMSGVNPEGCSVTSFKVPSPRESSHDFLWRIHAAAPEFGQIGIFNRSQYEDVLVVRVHNLQPESVWSKRYDQINNFEQILAQNNTRILKFFLHMSKAEQDVRFKKRLSDPDRNWKISDADYKEREYWDAYQQAYEDVLNRCSTKWAPWYVIPSDKKWFRNTAILDIIVSTLDELRLEYPKRPKDLPTVAGGHKSAKE